MKQFLIAAAVLSVTATPLSAQATGIVVLPDIPGFHTLKGDFHLHTVFSDGYVWPSFRVTEANRDGLDFIALTDHIDYQGNPADLGEDRNRPFDLAAAAARGSRLIVIRGGEISPRTPPYHANAVFLTDVNALPTGYMADTKGKFVMKAEPSRSELLAPFIEAKKQGAFIIYNHPAYLYNWDATSMGTDLLTSFHRELMRDEMLHGIEIVNGNRYYGAAHRIAIENNLALIAASDEHADASTTFRDAHRPMTLVFARDSTSAGIKEAVFARRTAVWFKDLIIGRASEMEPLFNAAVRVRTGQSRRHNEPLLVAHIENVTDVPFSIRISGRYEIDNLPLGRVTLAPRSVTTVAVRTLWDFPAEVELDVSVENMLTGIDEVLSTSFVLRHVWQR